MKGVNLGYWDRNEVYVIFEAGLNHNGDPNLAMRLVEAAAETGADAVKFQKRDIPSLATAEMLSWPESRFPSLGKTYSEVRTRLELDRPTYEKLRDRAHTLGLDFMVTPFDSPSLEFILDLGVDSIKVASHSVANPRLLREIATSGKPVVMSSGMVTTEELDLAVSIMVSHSADFSLLHCSSEYPTADEGANLRLLPFLQQRYGRITGFSGHEIGSLHTLLALGLGARLVERHVTLSNSMEGFDHKMSMEVGEFSDLVKLIRRAQVCMGSGDKVITPIEAQTRAKYRVSMVSARPLKAGEILVEDMICYKNPGTGIAAIEESNFIGRKLGRDVDGNRLIDPTDFI